MSENSQKRPRLNAFEQGDSETSWTLEWVCQTSTSNSNGDIRPNTARVCTHDNATTLCFTGRGSLRCLGCPSDEESVTVHGYTLRPPCSELPSSSSAVYFHSPTWSSWTTLKLPPHTQLEIESSRAVVSSNSADDDGVNDEVSSADGDRASFTVFAADDDNVQARPTVLPVSWKASVDEILENYDMQQLVREKQWHAIHRETLEDEHHEGEESDASESGFKVAIAGAKGVGKSTCLRYLVNRFLSKKHVQNVAVLDADCGQPEFSPPGMLSLTLVQQDEPLLQPPPHHYSNHREHVRAYFFGSVTSEYDPTRYMECLEALLQAYLDLHQQQRQQQLEQQDIDTCSSQKVLGVLPLVINLDGWVKGLGQQVLNALLQKTLRPHHVIQIVGDLKSKQFDVAIDESATTLHVAQAYNSSSEQKQLPQRSSAGTMSLLQPKPPLSIPASTLRSLRICAYFLQDDDDDPAATTRLMDRLTAGLGEQHIGLDDPACEVAHRLASARPYKVPFEAVEWRMSSPEQTHNIKSETTMLDVLNGSIVGLCCCRDDDKSIKQAGDDETRLLPCVGLGIVRAIDRIHRLFYILTPVPPQSLESVNVLSRGNIALPVECYFRGVESEGFPFQMMEGMKKADIVGVEPMRSRNSIARKRQTGAT